MSNIADGDRKMPTGMDRPRAPLQDTDRLLVVRLGAVGDVLRTLPALHLIRTFRPRAHLAWIVEDLSRELLVGHPEIDDVMRLPRRELSGLPWRRARAGLAALRTELRARRFTIAVDFQGTLKSALVTWLSGAPRRLGFAPGHCRELSFALTNEWVRPRPAILNRVLKNLAIAEALGAGGDEVTIVLPERPDEAAAAEAILQAHAPGGVPAVIFSPGTSERQRHKRWPPGHYGHLAALLAAAGVHPIIVWGPGEEETAREIAAASGGAARVAPPTGLRVLAALLRRAAAFVGADTGPMHLAWAVGCPVVAVFGPTDPRLNAPLGEANVVLRGGPSAAAVPAEAAGAAVRTILARRGGPSGRPSRPPVLSRRALLDAAS
jgi:heptosyltransferase-1